MSRISQEMAGKVANKMTEKSRDAVDILKKEFSNIVKEAYLKQTPTEVLAAKESFPKYFLTRRAVDFSGHGFRWESVSVDEPMVCNNGSSCLLELDDKLAEIITKSKRKWEKSKEEYDKLKSETTEALLALRTFKNIKEHFPSAEAFLPPPVSNALVVDFDKLKNKLDKQPKSVLAKEKV